MRLSHSPSRTSMLTVPVWCRVPFVSSGFRADSRRPASGRRILNTLRRIQSQEGPWPINRFASSPVRQSASSPVPQAVPWPINPIHNRPFPPVMGQGLSITHNPRNGHRTPWQSQTIRVFSARPLAGQGASMACALQERRSRSLLRIIYSLGVLEPCSSLAPAGAKALWIAPQCFRFPKWGLG